MENRTHESNVFEQVGEPPDTLSQDNTGYRPKDQSHYRDTDEQRNQAQDAHAEIADALSHDRRPQREHNTGQHDRYHRCGTDISGEWRGGDEPDVVCGLVEALLRGDSEDLWLSRGSWRGLSGSINAEEEGTVRRRTSSS